MALNVVKSGKEKLPEDAVVLSEDEALFHQWKIVTEWPNQSETWALRHTPAILAAFSASVGIYVNKNYRARLKLGSYGKLSTYIPIVVVPAMFSLLSHKFAFQRDILLKPFAECPVCLQTRSAALQLGIGVIYPTFLAPMSAFMYATRHYTYSLPSVTKEPKKVFNVWRKMTKPILPTISMIFAAQLLATMYLTGKELEQILQLQITLQKREKEAEELYEAEKIHKKHML